MNDVMDLVIVGAGPAGLAAARMAGRLDLAALVLDQGVHPGGQYFSHHPDGAVALPEGTITCQQLIMQTDGKNVQILSGVTVWNICPRQDGFDIYVHPELDGKSIIRARKVILATGAYERVLPFPGWTLAGVMATGAASLLSPASASLKGKHTLVYGTGPLLWTCAHKLALSGAHVAGILDINPFPWKGWHMLRHSFTQRARLQEALHYLAVFGKHRIPIYWNTRVIKAEGESRLKSVIYQTGQAQSTHQVETDYLFSGFGLLPSTELAQIAGAQMTYEPDTGCRIVARDSIMQTSLSGMFAVGDGVITIGKDAAALEGSLACMHAARQLGRPASDAIPGELVSETSLQAVTRALAGQRRFTNLLNSLFPFPAYAEASIPDETILCRCEGVTYGQLRQLAESGLSDADNLKAVTRAGMGRCQARFCGCNLAHLTSRLTGTQPGSFLSPRPPAFPVPIHAMVNDEVSHGS